MRKVEVYETSDRTLFRDERLAKEHQLELDFAKWWSENAPYNNTFDTWEHAYEWLFSHKEKILDLYDSVTIVKPPT